jgi:hypothetical protein
MVGKTEIKVLKQTMNPIDILNALENAIQFGY